MANHIRRPLTFIVMLVISITFAVTDGRPGTNFAGSAMTSDSSGTRSTQLIGTIPDSPPSSNFSPSSRIGNTNSVGGTSGSSGVGVATVSGYKTGGNTGSSTILTGTSSNGRTTGILTRSGPTGTQQVILGPSNVQPAYQPTVLGRFGSSGPVIYNTYGEPSSPGTGAFAGAGSASSGAFAGAGGASSGAFAGSQPVPDYYG